MNKKFFSFAVAACAALSFFACGSDGDDGNSPSTPQQVVLTKPVYADKAASYTIDKGLIESDGISLTAVNITESGKAILETTDGTGKKQYTTYGVTINGEEYQMKDKAGQNVGTMSVKTTRSSTGVTITVGVVIVLPGIGTVEVKTDSPVVAQMVINSVASGVNTDNIARTWKVQQMKMTLEGDVSASLIENSGNLAVLAKEAQDRGAGLTAQEMAEFNKVISGLTIDKAGLFSLEYADGSSEACSWKWTTANQDQLNLQLRNSDFGNKFFSDDSTIDVQFFTNGGCQIKLVTNIKGNKNYKCTLTIAMLQ